MSRPIKVVGMDPSMRNWGVAIGLLDLDDMKITIQDLKVISPIEPTGKSIKQNSKDIHVAYQHYSTLIHILADCSAAFAEIPIGSKSAAAMKGYGLCIGILGAMHESVICPFEVSPFDVKKVTGIRDASKKQMIDWATQNHPEAPWPTKTVKGVKSVIYGKAEHMADAVAAIHAGIKTDGFKAILPCLNQTYLKDKSCVSP